MHLKFNACGINIVVVVVVVVVAAAAAAAATAYPLRSHELFSINIKAIRKGSYPPQE